MGGELHLGAPHKRPSPVAAIGLRASRLPVLCVSEPVGRRTSLSFSRGFRKLPSTLHVTHRKQLKLL